jgi:hypothetical protein
MYIFVFQENVTIRITKKKEAIKGTTKLPKLCSVLSIIQ